MDWSRFIHSTIVDDLGRQSFGWLAPVEKVNNNYIPFLDLCLLKCNGQIRAICLKQGFIRTVISARDKNERKLFGFAFARLMEASGATLRDGAHELYVYKCDDPTK